MPFDSHTPTDISLAFSPSQNNPLALTGPLDLTKATPPIPENISSLTPDSGLSTLSSSDQAHNDTLIISSDSATTTTNNLATTSPTELGQESVLSTTNEGEASDDLLTNYSVNSHSEINANLEIDPLTSYADPTIPTTDNLAPQTDIASLDSTSETLALDPTIPTTDNLVTQADITNLDSTSETLALDPTIATTDNAGSQTDVASLDPTSETLALNPTSNNSASQNNIASNVYPILPENLTVNHSVHEDAAVPVAKSSDNLSNNNNIVAPPLANQFSPESGFFTVTDSQVTIDFLHDGGPGQGELGIFSLTGMENFAPGSAEFIQEAARRILSNSTQGYIAIADSSEGAKFGGMNGTDWNSGTYQGQKTFNFKPGDQVALMLVPNGTIKNALDNPNDGSDRQPLFSLATANPNDRFYNGQLVDVTSNSELFVMQETAVNSSSQDYDDIIFKMTGVNAVSSTFSQMTPTNDWRTSAMGQQIIYGHVLPVENTSTVDESAIITTTETGAIDTNNTDALIVSNINNSAANESPITGEIIADRRGESALDLNKLPSEEPDVENLPSNNSTNDDLTVPESSRSVTAPSPEILDFLTPSLKIEETPILIPEKDISPSLLRQPELQPTLDQEILLPSVTNPEVTPETTEPSPATENQITPSTSIPKLDEITEPKSEAIESKFDPNVIDLLASLFASTEFSTPSAASSEQPTTNINNDQITAETGLNYGLNYAPTETIKPIDVTDLSNQSSSNREPIGKSRSQSIINNFSDHLGTAIASIVDLPIMQNLTTLVTEQISPASNSPIELTTTAASDLKSGLSEADFESIEPSITRNFSITSTPNLLSSFLPSSDIQMSLSGNDVVSEISKNANNLESSLSEQSLVSNVSLLPSLIPSLETNTTDYSKGFVSLLTANLDSTSLLSSISENIGNLEPSLTDESVSSASIISSLIPSLETNNTDQRSNLGSWFNATTPFTALSTENVGNLELSFSDQSPLSSRLSFASNETKQAIATIDQKAVDPSLISSTTNETKQAIETINQKAVGTGLIVKENSQSPRLTTVPIISEKTANHTLGNSIAPEQSSPSINLSSRSTVNSVISSIAQLISGENSNNDQSVQPITTNMSVNSSQLSAAPTKSPNLTPNPPKTTSTSDRYEVVKPAISPISATVINQPSVQQNLAAETAVKSTVVTANTIKSIASTPVVNIGMIQPSQSDVNIQDKTISTIANGATLNVTNTKAVIAPHNSIATVTEKLNNSAETSLKNAPTLSQESVKTPPLNRNNNTGKNSVNSTEKSPSLGQLTQTAKESLSSHQIAISEGIFTAPTNSELPQLMANKPLLAGGSQGLSNLTDKQVMVGERSRTIDLAISNQTPQIIKQTEKKAVKLAKKSNPSEVNGATVEIDSEQQLAAQANQPLRQTGDRNQLENTSFLDEIDESFKYVFRIFTKLLGHWLVRLSILFGDNSQLSPNQQSDDELVKNLDTIEGSSWQETETNSSTQALETSGSSSAEK